MDIGHFLLTVVIHMTSCFFCLFFLMDLLYFYLIIYGDNDGFSY